MTEIAYNKISIYVRSHPGCNGKQIAAALGWKVDYLYPKLKEAQELGYIRKEGNTSNAKFYAVED